MRRQHAELPAAAAGPVRSGGIRDIFKPSAPPPPPLQPKPKDAKNSPPRGPEAVAAKPEEAAGSPWPPAASAESRRGKRELEENEILELVGDVTEMMSNKDAEWYWGYRSLLERQRRAACTNAFWLTVVVIALVIVENEISFYLNSWAIVNVVKIAMVLLSILTATNNFNYHRRHWMIGQLTKMEPMAKSFSSTHNFHAAVVETLIIMFLVPPFVKFRMEFQSTATNIPISERPNIVVSGLILDWFVLFRLFLVVRYVTYTSKFQHQAARILGAISKVQFDSVFVIKTTAESKPFTLLAWFYAPAFVAVSYGLFISERESHSTTFLLTDAMWLIAQTMIAIGYGDVGAESPIGRFFCVFCAVSGVLGLAFLVAFVSEHMNLNPTEERVVNVLLRHRIKVLLEDRAVRVVQASLLYHRLIRAQAAQPQAAGAFEGARREASFRIFRALQLFRLAKVESTLSALEYAKTVVSGDIRSGVHVLRERANGLKDMVEAFVSRDMDAFHKVTKAVTKHSVYVKYLQAHAQLEAQLQAQQQAQQQAEALLSQRSQARAARARTAEQDDRRARGEDAAARSESSPLAADPAAVARFQAKLDAAHEVIRKAIRRAGFRTEDRVQALMQEIIASKDHAASVVERVIQKYQSHPHMRASILVLAVLAAAVQAYNITGPLTVSGLSAGGFMAVQYHVAYSKSVSGAAVFAGGPYFCARGSIENALTACTTVPVLLSVEELKIYADKFSSAGTIDPLSGLKNDKVFLFSGTRDTVVNPTVVQKAGEFYSAYGANVATEFTIEAEHCQPTDDFGNECTKLGSPFINKCAYDGAGNAFKALFGANLNPKKSPVTANFIKINQAKFFPSGGVIGLDDVAYVYVPTTCASGSVACSVHIDFHGCNQEPSELGKTYIYHAGYADWAEANNIIVLFPQAKEVEMKNPEGCFDWWGYSGSNYAARDAPQMTTFTNMVKALQQPGITAAALAY